VLGLVLAVAIAAGVYYWRGGFAQSGARVADKDKVDPDVALLHSGTGGVILLVKGRPARNDR